MTTISCPMIATSFFSIKFTSQTLASILESPSDNVINNKILKSEFEVTGASITESQIKYNISAKKEEYCYHINSDLISDDLEKKAAEFADCVYANKFIHQYFETMKNSFAKSLEEKMAQGKNEKEKDYSRDLADRCFDSMWMNMGGIVL